MSSKREKWIRYVNEIHNNFYDYSKVEYVGIHTKVTIICPIHGEFKQTPQIHKKSGCPQCKKEKFRKTMLERYGVEHPSQSRACRAKKEHVMETRYGVKNASHSPHLMKKRAQTNLERYGTDNPAKNKNIRKKIIETNNKRYACDFPLQSTEIRQKTHQTLEERYGVKYPASSQELRERSKDTLRNKYGINSVGQNNLFKSKKQQTVSDRYGVTHISQRHIPESTLKHLNDQAWLKKQHSDNKTITEIAQELGVSLQTVCNYFHKHELGIRNFFSSRGEREVREWLEVNNIKTTYNSRNIIPPYELDIFIPEYKIAIEYCGLYWHSEQQGKDRHYHYRKYQLCRQKGIRLITMFEDEWLHKQDIVKMKLLSLCDKDPRETVYARSTVVDTISTKEYIEFFNKTHIQGSGRGSICYGLKTKKGKLIACILLKKHQLGYEVIRYSTSVRVVGGFSKLLNYVRKNHPNDELMTFADLRWSEGELYLQTGWQQDKIIPPDYYYSPDGTYRFHKSNYRRNKLRKKLAFFDPSLSEWKNCKRNNILRIWDCGKIRFKYHPKAINNDV